MDYSKLFELSNMVFVNPTVWLLLGPFIFNITWMKFERNVRYGTHDLGFPSEEDLNHSLPFVEYAVHFYSFFIGWVLYEIEMAISIGSFLQKENGATHDLIHAQAMFWLMFTLFGGLFYFLSGVLGNPKILHCYKHGSTLDRFLSRLSVARNSLLIIVFLTIIYRVYA